MARSPAASLDFALSKQPCWLLDMFGVTGDGTAFARRLFHRRNPERKRPGPVVISVNAAVLPPADVEVYRGETRITCSSELNVLAEAILPEAAASPARPARTPLVVLSGADIRPAPEPPAADQRSMLRDAYVHEALTMLRATDIFTPSRFRTLKIKAVRSEAFKRIAGRKGGLLTELDADLYGSARLGLDAEVTHILRGVRDGRPIDVAVSPAHAGTLVILMYLESVARIPFRIRFVAHSVEMAHRMLTEDFVSRPDICSLTISTAAVVCGKGLGRAYTPFMFMPKLTHGLIAPAAAKLERRANPLCGEYLLMTEIPSSELFCFEDLVQTRTVSRRNARTTHAEPDEVHYRLASGDPRVRAIIGFPYYVFNRAAHGCDLLNDPSDENALKETVLFANREFLSDPNLSRALRVLIRDAWYALRNSPALVSQQVDRLMNSSYFMRFLARCLGAPMQDAAAQQDDPAIAI